MICFCVYSPHCPWSSFSISGHMAPRVFQGGHRGKLHSAGGGGGVTAQEQVRRETARVEIKVRSPQLLGKCWETLGSSPPLSEEVLELPLGAKKKTTIQKTTSGNCHCRVLTQVLCPAPGAISFDGYKGWCENGCGRSPSFLKLLLPASGHLRIISSSSRAQHIPVHRSLPPSQLAALPWVRAMKTKLCLVCPCVLRA